MKTYVGTLIWTMLFVIVIEMIFPQSQLRKYLKLVLGFMVVYAILFPLLQTKWIPIEAYGARIEDYTQGIYISESYETKVREQQQKTEELYTEYMEEMIAKTIESETGIQVISLSCKASASKLESIELVITPDQQEEQIKIPQIRIANKSDQKEQGETKQEKEIKSCLKNFYNLEDVNIYITVQGN